MCDSRSERRLARHHEPRQRKDLTMNANEIAFGIEFETTLPASDTTPIGA
jgi:hypothetical protein